MSCPVPSRGRPASTKLATTATTAPLGARAVRSGYNRDPISKGARSLKIGDLELWPPVIAAPMAGISCAPYRSLATKNGAALAVSEMVIASTYLAGYRESGMLTKFGADEDIRSVQLYGVNRDAIELAVQRMVDSGVHHVDLNFGCPVRKVTRKGGGAALPVRPRLLAQLIDAAVRGAAGRIPITCKFRIGLDDSLITYLEAGRVAEACGAAAITLHARTAVQQYDPPARWDAIASLVQAVNIPVIGNGDVYEASDALRMMQTTGCAGVMVGRAALGRPWLFRSLRAAFEHEAAAADGAGTESSHMLGADINAILPPEPCLGEVLGIATQHLTAVVQHYAGFEDEWYSIVRLRKLVPLYLLGFASAAQLKGRLLRANSLAEWHAALAVTDYDPLEPFPQAAVRAPRLKGAAPGADTHNMASTSTSSSGGSGTSGRASSSSGGGKAASARRVALPDRWVEDRLSEELPAGLDDVACEG